MRRVKIKDVFDLQMGKTPSRNRPEFWNNGDNDWISIRDLGSFDKYVGKTAETISDQGIVESGIKVVPANTLVMSFKLSLGKTAITVKPTYTNEAIMAFIDKGVYPINLDYFYHQFSGRDWTAGTNKAVMGATLNKKSLGETLIVVPDDREQREVAAVLDRVDGNLLLARRRLQHLDDLVKSRFVEMFGVYNENADRTLQDFSELVTVGIANAATHAYADAGVVMLRNLNVRENYLDDGDLVYIKPEFAAKYRNKALKAGDILVTRTGYPGIACLVPEKYEGCQTFTTLIVRLKRDAPVTATYVSQLINSPLGKDFVRKMKAGSSQQNFGATSLKKMPIGTPPLASQQEFEVFVTQVNKSKFAVQQSIEQLELLKASLMQEYFG